MSEVERALSARKTEVYAGMVDRMDCNVGKLMDFLLQKGWVDNTVIMFLSDNGAEGAMVEAMPIIGPIIEEKIDRHFDNSLLNIGRASSCCWYGPRWAQAATAPSRLHKSYTTEGGIKVPFFVRDHRRKKQGIISHEVLTAMDIAATILDMASVDHPGNSAEGSPEPMRGRSIMLLLDGTQTTIYPPDAVFGWELFGRRAVRRGRWKALRLAPPAGCGAWELMT